jgi:hypothetical protein
MKVRSAVTTNAIEPVFPNPFSGQTTLTVLAKDPSSIISTVHLLDGTEIATVVDQEVRSGAYTYAWDAANQPDGLYQIRSRLQTGGQTVAHDTAYAALVRSPSDAYPIGSTGTDGRISTTNRSRFPGLHEVPKIDLRGGGGSDIGDGQISKSVQFVVTTGDDQQATFLRPIENTSNTITLTLP